MWATDKNVKMMNQLQLEKNSPLMKKKVRSLKSVEGRVVALSLSTFFFGYALAEICLFPNVVWYYGFGQDMLKQIFIGPCFGLIPLGAALGVIIGHFLQDCMSRRIYLVILNILILGSTAPLQAGGVIILFVFRTLQGVVCGMIMKFIPVYIGELTPKELGSRFGVYPQIAVVLGVLVAYVVPMIMQNVFGYQLLPGDEPPSSISVVNWQIELFWRLMLSLGMLFALVQLLLIAVGYIPESPTSLLLKNKKEEAKEVLYLFYQNQYVDQILEEKQKKLHEDTGDKLQKSINWTCRGYFIGFLLAIFQAMTGIAAYVTQTGHIIAVSLKSPIFSIYTPIVITIAQLVGTFLSIPLLRFLEWRSMTLIGGYSCALWNGLIGMFFYFFYKFQDFQNYGLTLGVVTILAFMFTFGVTVGSSAWPYASYMMPSGAILVAQVLNWLIAGATIIFFSVDVNSTGGPQIMIWVFCGTTLLISLIFSCLMPKIKDLNVIEVQQKMAHHQDY